MEERTFPGGTLARRLLGASLLVACTAVGLASAGDNGRIHDVPRLSHPIEVDAVLDEPAWSEALELELAYEVEPGENIPAPVRTRVLLGYDDEFVYVAFRAWDPDPSQIRARYSDRDQLGDDDWVHFVLDTFHDGRRAFDFFVNPLGIQMDAIESSAGGFSREWDTIWESAGRIVEDGFIVEVAIPFSSLRFQPADGAQEWGFDAVRMYPRLVRHKIGLFPRDRNNNCYLCQTDTLRGFVGIDPGHSVELDPTLTAIRSEQRDPFPDGDYQTLDSSVDLGLTARWGVTPNLNLSATVNPDFSQVEADAAQLEINTQFALFYPEKRPFFLEGLDYFDTFQPLVYTRTLADPVWGLKAAGKIGPGVIGVFSVGDDVTNLLFPDTEGSASGSFAEQSTGSVLRYRHDVGASSTIGGLITDREGPGYHNRLASVDVDLRFTINDRLQGQASWSDTRYPSAIAGEFDQPRDDFTGRAINLMYTHSTRDYELYGLYRETSPGFRADLGFMPQVGYRYYDTGALFIWQQNDPAHWYNYIKTWIGYEHTDDWDGNMLRSAPGTFIEYRGPYQTNAFANLYWGRQTYQGVEYDDRTYRLNFSTRPVRDLALGLQVNGGDAVDFTYNRGGDRLRVTPSVTWYAGRHLSFEFDHIWERFDLDDGRRLYTANLSDLRTVYQFNSRTFVRLILQYADYDYETASYPEPRDPEFKRLLTQLLFTYKINPWTALYVGYSDRSLGDSEVALTRLDRTAFLKIGYAWVP